MHPTFSYDSLAMEPTNPGVSHERHASSPR